MSNIFDPTIEKLIADKQKFESLLSLFNANKDALSRSELIFLVQNYDINHKAIIDDLSSIHYDVHDDDQTGLTAQDMPDPYASESN